MIETGSRVVVRARGSEIDGWKGTVEAVTPQDVMVLLDQGCRQGRLVSLPPRAVALAEPPK